MSTESPLTLTSRDLTISTADKTKESVKSQLQGQLRHFYSRRLFIQEVDYAPEEGHLSVTVGIAYPQDVSGSRSEENVLKMVNVGNVSRITASEADGGYFKFDLPSRSDLYQDYKQQHERLLADLDWSMARAIYGRVYQLNPVRNQLNSVIQILNWTRRIDGLTVEQVREDQSNQKTDDYLRVLENLGFIRTDDEFVYPGRKIESADLHKLSRREYERRVVGELVNEGYYALREELGLRMLNHFPKFANAYYLAAFRRGDKGLWLSVDDVVDNLHSEYGSDEGRAVIEDKLWDLSRDNVDVLKYEGDEVRGNSEVYDMVLSENPMVG